MIKTVLLVIISFMISYTQCRSCISCNHDPNTAPNWDCVGGNATSGNFTGEIPEEARGQFIFECTEAGGTEYCYTKITAEPNWSNGGAFPSKIEDMKINRGCCDVKSGSPTCPTSGSNHVDGGGAYEIWRYKCKEEDNCNFYAPKGIGSGGGGSESNGVGNCDDLDTCRIVVKAKGAAERITLNLMTIFLAMYTYKFL